MVIARQRSPYLLERDFATVARPNCQHIVDRALKLRRVGFADRRSERLWRGMCDAESIRGSRSQNDARISAAIPLAMSPIYAREHLNSIFGEIQPEHLV